MRSLCVLAPLRVALLLAATFGCGGCFQLSSVLTVKGDGSGTVQQRVLFTSAGLAQIRGLAMLGGGQGRPFDPVSEEQARAAAASMGTGVTFLSSAPITTNDGEGRDITYAFTDVTQLKISPAPAVPGGMSLGAPRPSSAVSFQISPLPDGHTLLRITVPRPPAQSGGTASSGILGQIPLGQMAMFKSMLVGARLSIAVEPAGQLVRTSSPYVDGSRVTLIDVDLDQLLTGDTLSRLQAAQTPEDAKAILDNTPGVKVNLDPEITIEFVAAK